MSNYDEEVRRRDREAFKAEQSAEKEKKIVNVAELGRAATRLRDLAANPEVQWFRDIYLMPKVKEEHDASLDVTRGRDECFISAHRHKLAKELVELLDVTAAALLEAARRAAEEIRE